MSTPSDPNPQFPPPGEQPQPGQFSQPGQYNQPGQHNQPDQSAQPGQAPGYGPGAAPGPYGGAPGGYQPGPSGPLTPPQPVQLAVKLMYVGAGLSVLGILVSLLTQDELRKQLEATPGMTPSQVDTALSAGMIGGVVMTLIGIGLWILNARFNAKGAGWARILSTVLGVISVLSGIFSLTQPAPILSKLLTAVSFLLAGFIVFLLWRPESSRFYDAVSERKIGL